MDKTKENVGLLISQHSSIFVVAAKLPQVIRKPERHSQRKPVSCEFNFLLRHNLKCVSIRKVQLSKDSHVGAIHLLHMLSYPHCFPYFKA